MGVLTYVEGELFSSWGGGFSLLSRTKTKRKDAEFRQGGSSRDCLEKFVKTSEGQGTYIDKKKGEKGGLGDSRPSTGLSEAIKKGRIGGRPGIPDAPEI